MSPLAMPSITVERGLGRGSWEKNTKVPGVKVDSLRPLIGTWLIISEVGKKMFVSPPAESIRRWDIILIGSREKESS